MTPLSATKVFPNSRRGETGSAIWALLQAVTALGWIGMAALLHLRPDIGLPLLWKVVVPSVPALIVFVPTLWRRICPMASANQLPQLFSLSRGWSLPSWLQDWTFSLAIFAFFTCIALRMPYFNRNGDLAALALLVPLPLALLGGLAFKGRSGWCGTFCPLAPIQRAYGSAPAVAAPPTNCVSCVGCQKNCFDLNPQAAIFDDLHDSDPHYSGQHLFFMAMLPGLIFAYFYQGQTPDYSYLLYLAILVAAPLTSVGAYYFGTSFLHFDKKNSATSFAALAICIFYWFAAPTLIETLASVISWHPGSYLLTLAGFFGLIPASAMVWNGLKNSRLYDAALKQAAELAQQNAPADDRLQIHEADSNRALAGHKGQSLLEILLGNDVKITASCKSGFCGSDVVYITQGMDNLSPPTPDELATLKRAGHGPQARLACCCTVSGPVSLTRNPPAAPAVAASPAPAAQADPAAASATITADRLRLAMRQGARSGSERSRSPELADVVILGNGIAGITVADELRKKSPGTTITIVSAEAHHFYNRMAIAKIVENKDTPQSLMLQPPAWYAEKRIDVLLGERATSLDRAARIVSLSNGRQLVYDRLVFATGARPQIPEPMFLARANCFTLNSASDAVTLRHFMNETQARSALVIGGGVLAVEAAQSLCLAGLRTTLVVRAETLMNRNIDAESSALLQRYLQDLGVEIRFNARIAGFEGGAVLKTLVLDNGERLTADLFLSCIGTRLNTELAAEAGLEIGHGIRVNPFMVTSDPAILAVGDVAELPGHNQGLWPIAVAQGRTAVQTMCGTAEPYQEPPLMLRLKSEGIELRAYGAMQPQPGDDVLTAPLFSESWWRIILQENRVRGAVYAGPPGDPHPLWKMVQANLDVPLDPDSLRQQAQAPRKAQRAY